MSETLDMKLEADNKLQIKKQRLLPILSIFSISALVIFHISNYVIDQAPQASTGSIWSKLITVSIIVIIAAGWSVLLFSYSRTMQIKKHRSVFILLSIAQITYACTLFVSTSFWQSYISDSVQQSIPIVLIIVAGYFFYYIAWLVGLIIIAADRKVSPLIRVASGILALCLIFSFSLVIIFGDYIKYLNGISPSAGTDIKIMSDILVLSANLFFIAAISFGKSRQPEAAGSDEYCMKANSRKLFWAVLLYLPISLAFELPTFAILLPVNNSLDHISGISLVIVRALFIPGILLALLILYAKNSNIPSFRKLLYCLAGVQLLSIACFVREDFQLLSAFSYNLESQNLDYIFSGFKLIIYVTWVVCLILIIRNKRSGAMLRISSVAFLIYHIFSILIEMSLSLPLPMIKVFPQLAKALMPFFEYFINFMSPLDIMNEALYQYVYIFVAGFFFAALSFARQKQPKTDVSTRTEPLINDSL